MSKDFFDEEYEKMEKKENESQNSDYISDDRKRAMNEWYSSPAPSSDGVPKKNKPWYIALICLVLVAAIMLGWLLCSLFSQNTSEEQTDNRESLLSEVIKYMDETWYYQDVSNADWEEALAEAGTAMLQSAGDSFCYLFTPQQMYDVIYQSSSTSIDPDKTYFGISYSFSSGLGLYVSSVQTDSSCYGVMQSGDIILKLTDIVYDASLGTTSSDVDTSVYELIPGDMDSATFSAYMNVIKSAKFSILRDSEVIVTDTVTRGKVGVETDYDFESVEFYFKSSDGTVYTNVSTAKNQNRYANANTYSLRQLEKLPDDTGYIRLADFMYSCNDDGKITRTASGEFAQVMEIFKQCGLKRLVLDLKGNGGGVVDYAKTIAGMLITDAKLDEEQKQIVTNGNGLLVTKLQSRSVTQNYTVKSTYSDYFDVPQSGDLCDIVVWTDGNSASASELLTGALKDYQTGFQIGVTTYGKGIAQTYDLLPYTGTITTEDGEQSTFQWGIYYTVAKYYSPLGTNIHGVGYTPDDEYDDCSDYEELWQATYEYWQISD